MDRNQQPQLHTLKEIDLLPLREVTLSNGARLFVVHSPKDDVLRFDIAVESGQWRQDKLLQCSFTNNMLRLGTQSLSAQQIAEETDFRGTRMGFQSSFRHNIISVLSLKKYQKDTFQLVSQMMNEATMPADQFDILAQKRLNRFLMQQHQTSDIAYRRFFEAVYGKEHRNGHFATENSYKEITRDDAIRFYEQYYNSANCTYFISGNVTDDTIALIDQTFGCSWGEGTAASSLSDMTIHASQDNRLAYDEPDAVQTSIRIGGPTISVNHPDYVPTNVMLTLYGGYFGSRLSQNIREDKGYTYGIMASMRPQPFDSILYIGCETANEYAESVIKEVMNETVRLKNEPVTLQELQTVKNYMIGDICRSYEGAVALGIATVNMYCLGMPLNHLEESVRVINAITPEQIMEMAQRHLNEEQWKVVSVGKRVKEN